MEGADLARLAGRYGLVYGGFTVIAVSSLAIVVRIDYQLPVFFLTFVAATGSLAVLTRRGKPTLVVDEDEPAPPRADRADDVDEGDGDSLPERYAPIGDRRRRALAYFAGLFVCSWVALAVPTVVGL